MPKGMGRFGFGIWERSLVILGWPRWQAAELHMMMELIDIAGLGQGPGRLWYYLRANWKRWHIHSFCLNLLGCLDVLGIGTGNVGTLALYRFDNDECVLFAHLHFVLADLTE